MSSIHIWMLVDGNTWEVQPESFFFTEEAAQTKAHPGEVIAHIYIWDSGSGLIESWQHPDGKRHIAGTWPM